MKIEDMNREVVYPCSQRDNGERHPCLTSGERSCGISIALSKWKVNGGSQEGQGKKLHIVLSHIVLEPCQSS